MSKWKITSTHGVSDEMVKLGFARTIVIECETAHIPQDRQGDVMADFNGFEILLHQGDKIEQVG